MGGTRIQRTSVFSFHRAPQSAPHFRHSRFLAGRDRSQIIRGYFIWRRRLQSLAAGSAARRSKKLSFAIELGLFLPIFCIGSVSCRRLTRFRSRACVEDRSKQKKKKREGMVRGRLRRPLLILVISPACGRMLSGSFFVGHAPKKTSRELPVGLTEVFVGVIGGVSVGPRGPRHVGWPSHGRSTKPDGTSSVALAIGSRSAKSAFRRAGAAFSLVPFSGTMKLEFQEGARARVGFPWLVYILFQIGGERRGPQSGIEGIQLPPHLMVLLGFSFFLSAPEPPPNKSHPRPGRADFFCIKRSSGPRNNSS